MKSTSESFSFKELLAKLPRGEPVSTSTLQRLGASSFRASALARSGWLVHLAHGAYLLPGDTLSRDGSLAFLAEKMPGLHVGGKTALAWRGMRHNVAFREHIVLWGDKAKRLPEWFTQRFPASFQATRLFDERMQPDMGIQPLPGGDKRVLVSVPERALLELLSDVGKAQSLSEARSLVESTPSLRTKVLDELLLHTTRIKVIRLAATFGADLGLPWADVALKHSERIGGGARWIAVTKSGERVDLRRP
jgi:hypothetical protein